MGLLCPQIKRVSGSVACENVSVAVINVSVPCEHVSVAYCLQFANFRNRTTQARYVNYVLLEYGWCYSGHGSTYSMIGVNATFKQSCYPGDF